MIELPRAALRAADIAAGPKGADFFSFGTNDMTQTVLGLSRDDAAPILSNYLEHEVIAIDPFVSIDQAGVGELVKIGVERGRSAKPDLKTGICGEHGGDPRSIGFFEDGRPRLRLVLALSRADRTALGGAGRHPPAARREQKAS